MEDECESQQSKLYLLELEYTSYSKQQRALDLRWETNEFSRTLAQEVKTSPCPFLPSPTIAPPSSSFTRSSLHFYPSLLLHLACISLSPPLKQDLNPIPGCSVQQIAPSSTALGISVFSKTSNFSSTHLFPPRLSTPPLPSPCTALPCSPLAPLSSPPPFQLLT
eukprot:113227-Hanusia_phi.AAC.1